MVLVAQPDGFFLLEILRLGDVGLDVTTEVVDNGISGGRGCGLRGRASRVYDVLNAKFHLVFLCFPHMIRSSVRRPRRLFPLFPIEGKERPWRIRFARPPVIFASALAAGFDAGGFSVVGLSKWSFPPGE